MEAKASTDRAYAKPAIERKNSGVKAWGTLVDSKLQLDILDKIQKDISNVTRSKYLLLFFLPSIIFFDKKTPIFLNEPSLSDSVLVT